MLRADNIFTSHRKGAFGPLAVLEVHESQRRLREADYITIMRIALDSQESSIDSIR
jgi:hypothetical protein